MNNDYRKTINALVLEFEAMTERGVLSVLNERSYKLLIEHFIKEDIYDRAIEVLDYAIKNYSNKVEFYIRKARILLITGQIDEASSLLSIATDISPMNESISFARAELLYRLNLYDEALAILDLLKESEEVEMVSNAFLLEANIYKSQGLNDLVFPSLEASLLSNTRNEDAFDAFWSFAEFNKAYQLASDLYEKIIEQDPYSYLNWYYYGHALSYLGSYHEAAEAYEYAFIIEPDFEPAYKEFIEVCFQLRLYVRALSCCEEFNERFDMDSDCLKFTGLCFKQLANYTLAKHYLHEVLQYEPLDDEILFHLGDCYMEEIAVEKAIWYYSKAVAIEDNCEEYHCALAKALFQSGRNDEAEDHYRLAIDICPETPLFWLEYASFLIQCDQKESALELLMEAEENTIGNEALFGKIACLFCMGRRQEALFRLTEIISLDYESHPILFEILPELTEDSEVINLIARCID